MDDRANWLDSLRWQLDFAGRAKSRPRRDREFDWAWHQQVAGAAANVAPWFGALRDAVASGLGHGSAGGAGPFSAEWLEAHAAPLWETRRMLEDGLSRVLFDAMLVLRGSSPTRFYFPRIDFEDYVDVVERAPFEHASLPTQYLGLPLEVCRLNVRARPQGPPIAMITTDLQVRLLNSYRQYLIRRGDADLAPRPGDVVLDCGACIGEFSLLFASLVGPSGQVHLFDPVPLHIRYCELQAGQNPAYRGVFRANALAVDDRTHTVQGSRANSDSIAPGGLAVDAFSATALDDYAAANLERLDFVKMDIEGAELRALHGARQVIAERRPRLAISAYHQPEHLWEIPDAIRACHAGYRLYFGHHSPVAWESVYYAHA